jgi:peptidoglycan/xylan/chitin deacetylase (PgdA/CDA1 family)
MPRILKLLESNQIHATFFIPGFTANQYPELIKEIHRKKHEIGNHGWSHTYPDNMSGYDEEVKEYKDCSDIIERLTGSRPKGYRSPAWEFSKYTLDIIESMAEIEYSSNMMDSERIKNLSFGGRTSHLMEIPIHWVLDDAAYWLYSLRTPGKSMQPLEAVENYWITEFDAILEEFETEIKEQASSNLAFVLTCHPQIIGRPARMKVLERVIKHIKDTGKVEFMTGIEAATMFKNRKI